MIERLWRALAAAALLAALPCLAQPLAVQGEPAVAPKSQPVAKLHIPAASAAAPRLRAQAQLAPVAEMELETVREANRRAGNRKRLVIGVNRAADFASQLPAGSDLRWVAVDGGQAAQAAVTSPQAAALRLAIELSGVPAELEMVFFGSAAPWRLVGPVRVGDIAGRSEAWWSPLTEGDTQTVEFFVPGASDAGALPLRIVNASHLFADPSSGFRKRVQDIGDAGTCNVDVPCSALVANAGFRNAAEAVAQMVFTEGAFTVMCTGTLLNDSDPATQIPWFYSANHCFENETPPYRTPAQMQAVANTLNTLWHFEAATCGSLTPSTSYSQLAGGATYVYNDPQLDVLFLRLNNPPPAGAFFSGWDAKTLAPGTNVVTIHHPRGDLKKVSEGMVLDLSAPSGGVGGASTPFIRVGWGTAITEAGSSGAGILTYDGAQYSLRGGLWGGPSSCSVAPSNRYDYFSRFDLAYPSLAQYLGAASTVDYTDLWWNPAESGWGLSLVQHPGGQIFGVWYTYAQDRKPTWYVMPGGAWTASNVYRGDLYVTSGPAQTAAFDAKLVTRSLVGNATLTFSDAGNGTFAYSIDGVAGTKAITRQPF